MFDFLTQNSIYIVLLIVLMGWIGIFLYLLRLDKKIDKLKKLIKD
ncbi:MAG: CcmD family protein [Bacteroidota bacterium]|nr:CcmD family protein [Bacteroidota bacterium]